MPNLPSGTITFLFTDIEGSTKLWQEYPDQMKVNLAKHDELLRQVIEHNKGFIFKTVGDAFCAAFSTTEQGIIAAIESQQTLAKEDWGECIVKVRMGLHTGDAEERDNDYFGNTLNRVARLMSAGHGGQILISQATQELVSADLPAGAALRDLGKHRLKDLIQLERIFQLEVKGVATDFPTLKTLDIQLNNLPTQLTHFVGRDREISALMRLLRNPEVHLVTLTGPGGTGKTRLSLQVAANLLDEYEHGAWFVELASITDPELFLPTVASTLKVKEAAGRSIADMLNEYFADKQLLLVLDNFEQIVSAAPQISRLLNSAPKVKVLVSSREVLRLRGEHDYPVPPLGLPESKRKQTAAVLAQYEAIALFTQHAQAVNPEFELNEDNANIVAEICMKLDGLPLAIELAAARARLLKPAAMLEKLKNKLDTLTSGARDLPRRQQTIRNTIDWSYDLLDDAEKVLFARLGIFVGGWTLESAEAVCGEGLNVDILNGIESLLDKSLIRQTEGRSGETRFAMLETIREYAHEKLSQGGELGSIQQAHAEYIEQFLQKVIAIAAQNESQGLMWFAKLDDEPDNLRSVMEWALVKEKPEYVLPIGRFSYYWVNRLRIQEPLNWLERALAMEGGTPFARASAMNSAGNLLRGLGEFQKARAFYEASLVLWREMGDAGEIARELNNLGNLAWEQEKDYEKAQRLYEEVLGEVGHDPKSWIHAIVLSNLGSLAKIRDDYSAAQDYYTRARQIGVNIGFEGDILGVDGYLGMLALSQRKLDEAQAHFESWISASWVKGNPLLLRRYKGYTGYVQLLRGNIEGARKILDDAIDAALEIYEQAPNTTEDWMFLDAKARLELIDNHFERSAQLFGAAWIQREEDDCFLTEFERPEYEARIAEVRAGMGDAAFEATFQKGQSMSLKDALLFMLE